MVETGACRIYFSFKKSLQLADSRRVAHLAQGFCLNLADAFARDVKLLADFFKGSRIAVLQAKAQAQYLAFARRKRFQYVHQFFAQKRICGHIVGIFRRFILNEIAKICVVGISHRALEEIGCWAIFIMDWTRSTGKFISVATSSGVGSCPSSCSSCFYCITLLSVSIMWTGMRIVRAWSAMERVIAWRIHHVAYVENL